MARPVPHTRSDYPHTLEITTRWNDNDAYGHMNNSVYYFLFDTVVNRFLIDNGLLDIQTSKVIGLVVHTDCNYFSPIAFPDSVTAGLRTVKVGSSSVTYEIALFKNQSDTASAQGTFVHVYVDKETSTPQKLSDEMRAALDRITAA